MNISRYMTESLVKLKMETVLSAPPENGSFEKWRTKSKELVLEELVALLDSGAHIGNTTKLLNDFVYRERQCSTGIGSGVAFPHIRSKHAKDFMIAFARSEAGYEFDTIDNEPAHLFFVMAAPPYDDSLYLKAFKALSEMLREESFRQELMTIDSPGEVIRAIRAME